MSLPEFRNAVVLVIDRLGANMLGAYGSTWFETRNFNRLAARSLVFDHAITTSTELKPAYEGLWNCNGDNSLIRQMGEAGVGTILMTDEPAIANLPLAEDFDRVVPVQLSETHGIATKMDQTELASFFAQASQAITELESGSCLWLHSRGLSGAWDAPQPLRTQLADPEDPAPPTFFQPPARIFDPRVDDPDELLGYQQVCAAQVTLIDDFLGVILDLIESEIGDSTLFCLLSTRGFPLGEHGLVGDSDSEDFGACHNESIHVPMMVCLPNQPEFDFARSIRNGSIVQTNRIGGLLVDWFGSSDSIVKSIESFSHHLPDHRVEAAVSMRGDSAAIQTHAWKLIRNAEKAELFAKPDDRCEVNDVSRLCPQVVESLQQILKELVVNDKVMMPADFALSDSLAYRQD